MAVPNTPGEARRQGLRRSRWAIAGVSVGAAVLLTGTIAAVNAAPSHDPSTKTGVSSTSDEISDDDASSDDVAQPFTPQQPSSSSSSSTQFQPQTRSGGS